MSELHAILGRSIERLLADHVTSEVRRAACPPYDFGRRAEAGPWPAALCGWPEA